MTENVDIRRVISTLTRNSVWLFINAKYDSCKTLKTAHWSLLSLVFHISLWRSNLSARGDCRLIIWLFGQCLGLSLLSLRFPRHDLVKLFNGFSAAKVSLRLWIRWPLLNGTSWIMAYHYDFDLFSSWLFAMMLHHSFFFIGLLLITIIFIVIDFTNMNTLNLTTL